MKIPVAILCGGAATRLGSLTKTIPKSLILVTGKPMIFHQLDILGKRGINRVVLCVGHLGEMIRDRVGCEYQGIKIDYSFDGSIPLGTGGAIKKALPMLEDKFFVLYGDSYLPIEYSPILDFFDKCYELGLITVYNNNDKFGTSNVVFENGKIIAYGKDTKLESMKHIDYGLSLFKSWAFNPYRYECKFDLSEVFTDLLKENQLAGYEMYERFYEIGSISGLSELESKLQNQAR